MTPHGGPTVAVAAGADGGSRHRRDRGRRGTGAGSEPDGVLVLMDLGSAVMSAELAIELADLAADGAPSRCGSARRPWSRACSRRSSAPRAAPTSTPSPGRPSPRWVPSRRPRFARPRPRPARDGGGSGRPPPPPTARSRYRWSTPRACTRARRPRSPPPSACSTPRSSSPRTDASADGASSLELLTLGAEQGTEIIVSATGPDAAQALEVARGMIADGFGELDGPASTGRT